MLPKDLDNLKAEWTGKWVRFRKGGELVLAKVEYVIEHESLTYRGTLVTDRGSVSPEDVLDEQMRTERDQLRRERDAAMEVVKTLGDNLTDFEIRRDVCDALANDLASLRHEHPHLFERKEDKE